MAEKHRNLPEAARAEVADSPTFWFAMLEAGIREDDYELAAQADSNLKRLGVHVRFERVDRFRRSSDAGGSDKTARGGGS